MTKDRKTLTHAQREFIEDVGHLMATWGLTRNLGRMYAYLLLRAVPVSLDEIAEVLGVAKSGASVGARQLAGFGLARPRGERGSRRLWYEPVYSLEPMFAARQKQAQDWFEQLHAGARVAAPGIPRQRLRAMAAVMERFMEVVSNGMTKAFEESRPGTSRHSA